MGGITIIFDKIPNRNINRFYFNVLPRTEYINLINSNKNNLIYTSIMKWCPYCGININRKSSPILTRY